jgi:hypothetical protein
MVSNFVHWRRRVEGKDLNSQVTKIYFCFIEP